MKADHARFLLALRCTCGAMREAYLTRDTARRETREFRAAHAGPGCVVLIEDGEVARPGFGHSEPLRTRTAGRWRRG